MHRYPDLLANVKLPPALIKAVLVLVLFICVIYFIRLFTGFSKDETGFFCCLFFFQSRSISSANDTLTLRGITFNIVDMRYNAILLFHTDRSKFLKQPLVRCSNRETIAIAL